MRTEQSSSHCANLIVALPQEAFPLGESSKSPLHFAAHRDESVIVGYYTSEEVHLRSPSPSSMNLERRDALWQETMALTAPVSEISPFRTRPLATPSSTMSAKRTAIGTPTLSPSAPAWNVHFKKPTASYTDLFAQLEAAGTISTRGLKPDATHYCELVFDVNSAYFDNHGGYEFAKQFYEDAYKAAVQIVGGEQYILSAVMHADEINRAMTEALGREVYHYHLHVVYVPVVEKQILWSKRCKDKALVGTVKETVMQVSRSKKWASKPLLDDAGKPVAAKERQASPEEVVQCPARRFLQLYAQLPGTPM